MGEDSMLHSPTPCPVSFLCLYQTHTYTHNSIMIYDYKGAQKYGYKMANGAYNFEQQKYYYIKTKDVCTFYY